MTPVVKNLPLKSSIENPSPEIHVEMTPDEVTAYFDERDRQRHLAQIYLVVNVALVIVATALIFVIIGFFTH